MAARAKSTDRSTVRLTKNGFPGAASRGFRLYKGWCYEVVLRGSVAMAGGDRRWWVYGSMNQRLARAKMFPRPKADVIMKQTAPALPHSSVAQWQSIRLLTGGL